MQFTKPFAASAFCVSILFAQPSLVPSVEINYPGLNPNRYINITVDGPLHHVFGGDDQMAGFPLAQFLETAGWGQIPKGTISQYLVRIDGDDTATLPLSEILRRSFDNRVWLVMQQGGKALSRTEVPWVVAVASDGVVALSVKHVHHIRVTSMISQQPMDDVEFGRLAGYEKDEVGRTLWKKYVRVEGVSLMVLTSSTDGRPEKSAVLLSEQISKWDDRYLLGFLAGSESFGIDPEGTIKRVGEFTVVRLRFPF